MAELSVGSLVALGPNLPNANVINPPDQTRHNPMLSAPNRAPHVCLDPTSTKLAKRNLTCRVLRCRACTYTPHMPLSLGALPGCRPSASDTRPAGPPGSAASLAPRWHGAAQASWRSRAACRPRSPRAQRTGAAAATDSPNFPFGSQQKPRASDLD